MVENKGKTELKEIPGRVFLDTNIVNFILDYGENIFDGISLENALDERTAKYVDALYNIFLTGQRAFWQIAISPLTYMEIIKTKEPNRRHYIEMWFAEIWEYWLNTIKLNDDLPTFVNAEQARIELLTSGILDILPDIEDRFLICDSINYRCDLFCTKDWKTVLKYRDNLSDLPIKIVTPQEWWEIIKPYAGLWV